MIVTALAEPGHVDALTVLLEEMDRFYDVTEFESFDRRTAQVHEALFGDVPTVYALLAWNAADLVGMASYSFLRPAVGMTRSLYLKELYVTRGRQRQGIGKMLTDSLRAIAVKHGCSRIEWTTDRSNQDAQQFYQELGVPVNEEKLFYRISL